MPGMIDVLTHPVVGVVNVAGVATSIEPSVYVNSSDWPAQKVLATKHRVTFCTFLSTAPPKATVPSNAKLTVMSWVDPVVFVKLNKSRICAVPFDSPAQFTLGGEQFPVEYTPKMPVARLAAAEEVAVAMVVVPSEAVVATVALVSPKVFEGSEVNVAATPPPGC